MSDQQRTHVYQQALSDAQSELNEILGEFNELASRKTQLEHVMNVLTPLLDAAQSATALQAAPAYQAAPAQEFAPQSARILQQVAAPEAQPQFHDFSVAAPVQAAQPEVAQESEPVAPAALPEVSQPEPAVVFQQIETPAPQLQPANSGDRLEDRINFALNFALLS